MSVPARLRAALGGLGRLGERVRHGPGMTAGQRLLLLSILIGVFAGLLVVCFHVAIELLSWNTVGALGEHQSLWAVLWPALGAGVSFALVTLVFPASRGSGVNNTKAALYVSDGYLPARSVPGKFLACALSIGTGNPMGPEDPALQMGAGIASLLGRLFHLPRGSMKLVAPTGAAAGIAAAFNTPITGVLFVMEEVVASWSAGVLGSIVLSAVSAVVVTRFFLGDAHLFQVPAFRLTHPSELIIYALTGVVGGFLSARFIRYVTRLRAWLSGLGPATRFVLPVAAGLLVGVVGLWAPEVLGSGYGVIDDALHDGFAWKLLLLFALLKILTTSISFCVGTPGGMFAPALFIGAMLGGGIGGLAHLYWPLPTSSASAYVLVGIGTFFAGVFRAPMTSIFMVFEVSGSYAIIVPVMIANTIAYLVSRRSQHDSLFHIVSRQDGLDLPSVEDQREAPVLCVEEAMCSEPRRLLYEGLSPAKALEELRRRGDDLGLVASGPGRWVAVERSELEGDGEPAAEGQTLLQRVRGPGIPSVYPDMTLDAAMRLLSPAKILAVTSRANPRWLLGTLTVKDVLGGYGIRPCDPDGGG
jgi:CIC family chloride channel protein